MEKSQNFFEVAGNQQKVEQEIEREKKWEIEKNEIMDLKMQWHWLLVENFGDNVSNETTRIANLFIKKCEELGIEMSELGKVAAYNILIGSSPTFPKYEKIDLDGDLSIRKYFEEEIDRMREEKEEIDKMKEKE
jgi:hypothetical protein